MFSRIEMGITAERTIIQRVTMGRLSNQLETPDDITSQAGSCIQEITLFDCKRQPVFLDRGKGVKWSRRDRCIDKTHSEYQK